MITSIMSDTLDAMQKVISAALEVTSWMLRDAEVTLYGEKYKLVSQSKLERLDKTIRGLDAALTVLTRIEVKE